jgi:4-hydroxybenzoate polyprenyltransferase
LVSGSIYGFNDIVDAESDRRHPVKRNRPVASGKISPQKAAVFSLFIFLAAIIISNFTLNLLFRTLLFSYFFLMIIYSLWLKSVIILDVIVISAGFVIRAVSGAVVIDVEFSSWLIICTFFLALFLILCKRRSELYALGEDSANHRPILANYNLNLLDQMISVVTASAVITYALYTLSPRTLVNVAENLYITIPFVVYGIFRYLYLVFKLGKGESPEKLLIKDIPLIVNTILWIITVMLLIYFKL